MMKALFLCFCGEIKKYVSKHTFISIVYKFIGGYFAFIGWRENETIK